MKTGLDSLATALYVKTDDLLKASPQLAPYPLAVGIAPQLSDAELVTLSVMQAILGFTSEARWIRHARSHLLHLFPYLPKQPMHRRPDGDVWDPRVLESFEHRTDPPGMADRLLEAARQADVPVLVVRGQLSDVVREDAVEDFCARVPRAHSVEVAGAGHTMAGGCNDRLVDAIVPFLEGVGSQGQ